MADFTSGISLFVSYGLEGLFYVLIIVFTFHALFLGYHWLNYGNSKAATLIALAAYLGGASILFMTFSIALTKI